MADTFTVGEVAIYIRPGSKHIGKDVIVTSGLYMARHHIDNVFIGNCFVYDITASWGGDRTRNGMRRAVLPEHLRKKHLPPQSDFTAGEWELCPWQPKEKVNG